MLRTLVLIDYQNIHLTARDRWSRGAPTHESLIHPLHFAVQAVGNRNFTQRRRGWPAEQAELTNVVVYRGLPSNKYDPTAYRRSMAQQSEWTKDRRVAVNYRPLRYSVDGPREKGIDVLLALHLVRVAAAGDFGLVMLASHDTDLEPAIDEACRLTSGCLIETVGWQNAKRLKPTPVAGSLWHTFLGEREFGRSVDPKDYT